MSTFRVDDFVSDSEVTRQTPNLPWHHLFFDEHPEAWDAEFIEPCCVVSGINAGKRGHSTAECALVPQTPQPTGIIDIRNRVDCRVGIFFDR